MTQQVPWMIGYEVGRALHVFLTVFSNQNHPYLSFPDTLPHFLRITLYVIIINDQTFGLLAVFQMLLETRHLFQSPMNIMQYMGKMDTSIYNGIQITSRIIQPCIMFFAGPYCAFMLYYHWSLLNKYGFLTKLIFIFFIGINTLYSVGDIFTLGHNIMKYLFGFDITKSQNKTVLWIKEQMEKMDKEDNQERERIARAQGYSRTVTSEDMADNNNDSDTDGSLNSPNLGDNIQMTAFDVSG